VEIKAAAVLIFSLTHCQIVVVTLIHRVSEISTNALCDSKLATDRHGHSVLYSLLWLNLSPLA